MDAIKKITLSDFVVEIAAQSSLSRGDILTVLNGFIGQLPVYLKDGHNVQLGDLGMIHLSLKNSEINTSDVFEVDLNKNVEIVFVPGSELKLELENSPIGYAH